MSELLELKGLLAESDKQVQAAFTKFEGQIRENGEVTNKVRDEIKAQSERNDQIAAEIKRLEDEITALHQTGTKGETQTAAKTIGQQFVESEQFKSFCQGSTTKATMEFKNTIIGEGGSPQQPTDTIVPRQEMAGIVGGAFRSLRLLDLLNMGTATGNTVHYTRELTFVNAAAETAEAAQKPETTLTFESADVPVRTIPHFLKLSKQVLDDAPALQSYIDRRLRYGVELRVENQVLNGTGVGSNIKGMLASGNHTAITAASGDNNFDFANKAKYKITEGDYQADYFLVNSADWGAIERIKDSSGRYLGDNAVSYLQNGMIPLLWGLPVIVSNSVPAGKLLAVSNDSCMFWQRQATTVEIFDQNSDDVEKNLLTVRAEARGAFTVFRPAGIAAGSLPNPAA